MPYWSDRTHTRSHKDNRPRVAPDNRPGAGHRPDTVIGGFRRKLLYKRQQQQERQDLLRHVAVFTSPGYTTVRNTHTMSVVTRSKSKPEQLADGEDDASDTLDAPENTNPDDNAMSDGHAQSDNPSQSTDDESQRLQQEADALKAAADTLNNKFQGSVADGQAAGDDTANTRNAQDGTTDAGTKSPQHTSAQTKSPQTSTVTPS